MSREIIIYPSAISVRIPEHWKDEDSVDVRISFVTQTEIVFTHPNHEPEVFDLINKKWIPIRIGADGYLYKIKKGA